jgi:hypothetical protein
MTTKIMKTGILCGVILATVVAGALTSTDAQARGGKEYFSQDYQFDRPMHGFEGRQGNYYCSYQRIPNTVCDRNGRCKVKGWTLRQHCY